MAYLNSCAKNTLLGVPQPCLLCGAASARSALCTACGAELPWLTRERCNTCGVPLAAGGVCGACLRRPPHFDRVSAAFAYRFPLDALIHAFKYGGNLAVARVLGPALADAVRSERVDLIVPMPLSERRLRSRGFNQAHEIARIVGRRSGVAVMAAVCRRTHDTQPQAALPWSERARNVRGAFVCDADLTGRIVAVVDDVMTTGATLNELARNLKRAGAAEVRGWIAARTVR